SLCQAEDGIRVDLVTGVQTCALPIFVASSAYGASMLAVRTSPAAMREPTTRIASVIGATRDRARHVATAIAIAAARQVTRTIPRSEARRAGKLLTSAWSGRGSRR